MMIGSMVLIAVLTIYSRAENTAAAVTRDMSSSRLPYEALQLIAEDLDKLISVDSDTNFIMINRHINNYNAGIFVVRENYKDSGNKDQTYKELVWQCNEYTEGDVNDMVLYRSYESIAPEDKLLDKNKTELDRSAYVPICRGVTYFNVDVITDKKTLENAWPGGIPQGVVLSISFAKPYMNVKGQYEVPENEIYTRTVSFNKSRNIKFVLPDNGPNVPDEGETNITDMNAPGNQDAPENQPKPIKK